MKRIYTIFILLCCFSQAGMSQRTGTWKTYLAYYNTTAVAEGNNYVFALADGALYSYGKEDNSVNHYSKQTGLSDNTISCISYNADQDNLVIAYSNGNIDLWNGSNDIRNIDFIKESSLPDKGINAIYNYNEFAYLCTRFGIVVLDTKKQEIKETYRFNLTTTSVVIHQDNIYAAIDSTIMVAPLGANLIDPNNWTRFTTGNTDIDTGKVLQLCVFQNTLFCTVIGKGIFYRTGGGYGWFLSAPALRSMKVENGKLIAFTNASSNADLYIYSSLTERDNIKVNSLYDVSSLKDNNTFWLAAASGGLQCIGKSSSGDYQTSASIQNTDGPKRNYNDFMKIFNGKLYIAGGRRWENRYNRTGTVMIYDPEEKVWNNMNDVSGFLDPTSIAVDPADENHFFVTTWYRGLYEFKDNEYVKKYDLTNSELESTVTGSAAGDYIRTEGLCYDNNGNLWMTNTGNSNVIKVLKPDGTWSKLDYPTLRNPTLADKILIMPNGDKWVNMARATNAGVFVFNDNGTIDDTSDDKYRYINTMGDVSPTYFFCITADRNGDLWFGTDRGPIILYTPSRALGNPDAAPSFTRIIRTGADGASMYFLSDEYARAIAVDAGNRKWIGTESSGVYLVSEDGTETLEHFTTDNSILPSNRINSIAIDDNTGEVFIGTEAGLVSYFGEATGGSESYNNVYAYPNPVRPDFSDKVIITGLMDNSNIKITDVKGNLIYQTRSVGGQASWDCRNRGGRRVASGVYLVMAYTPDGKESVVTKIAVVK